jgi:hypothetical protein
MLRALGISLVLAALLAPAPARGGDAEFDAPLASCLSEGAAWDFDDLPASVEPSASVADAVTIDADVETVQAQAPAASLAPRRNRQQISLTPTVLRRAGRGVALGSLASIPYMIGDTGSGSCIGFTGLVDASLAHPTLACGRLNISEANSPIPTDRVYYSYRHFHNAGEVSAYQFSESLDVDTHTIAWENTFWDRTGSLEVRVPIKHRLRSHVISAIAPDFGIVDPLVAPGDGRRTELGNVSLLFKMLLVQRSNYAVSGGVGVTLPTAQDVHYQLVVQGEVAYPDFPGLTADQDVAFQAVFANETIYIAPFLAWIATPEESRWFHQGFLQFEAAANPSRVTVDGDGATAFFQDGGFIGFYDYFTPTPVRAELHAQPLMRLNVGTGYVLAERTSGPRLVQLASLFELHYTTTLADANLSDVPLTTQTSFGTPPLQQIQIGNLNNRVDILNAAVGLSGRWGAWILTTGAVAPLRSEPDRGFDFEYNTQLQRVF